MKRVHDPIGTPVLVAALILTLVIGGAFAWSSERASVDPEASGTPSPTPSLTPSPAPSPTPGPVVTDKRGGYPRPRAPLPKGPKRFARTFQGLDRKLKRDVEAWARAGAPRRKGALPVKLGSLYHQRMIRQLAAKPRFARQVRKHLRGRVRLSADRHATAGAKLRSLGAPRKPPVRMKTHKPARALRLKKFYKKAQRRFGVPWETLAAINLVETRMGRLLGPSTAGALGPMQFMPATWAAYGRGDIMSPHDSIMAAGRYLSANGAPDRMRNALWHYNHSNAYVDAVQAYTREIKRDPRYYLIHYHWQVFVRTTKGDVQLTGPGAKR